MPMLNWCSALLSIAMPDCANCGGWVTDQYARVFAPPGIRGVRVCPNCEDKLREKGQVRQAHSPRHTNQNNG